MHVRSQRANTRACTLIDCINDKVQLAASKYRKLWKALLALIGEGDWATKLQLLSPRHIIGPHDSLEEESSSHSVRRAQDMQNGLGEGFRVTS
jgi:hypothetical protein